ncbi:hypothetical protein [Frankia sp. R82]|nr:hypothetical protein [Frankia sp. R82]
MGIFIVDSANSVRRALTSADTRGKSSDTGFDEVVNMDISIAP